MPKDKNGNYPVGYKKPPKKTQFKKGQSGNPRGRKKGSRNVPGLYREVLEEKIQVTEGGKHKTMTVQEAIVRRDASNALKGKDSAIERAFQYAPKNEAEENRYTMVELIEMMDWDALKTPEEIDLMLRFFRLHEAGDRMKERRSKPT